MIEAWIARRGRRREALAAALLTLLAVVGCDHGPEPYGILRDAALSADEKTLLVLVEHGTKRTDTGNIWRGDITTEMPESLRVHEFDRSSGTPGRVIRFPAPTGNSTRGLEHVGDYVATAGTPEPSLKDCRELYTECAETSAPYPYRVGRRVLDPQSGRAIEWNSGQLVVAPFVAMTAAQIRAAREALFLRSVERMRAAAGKEFAVRAAAEDPDRIETGEAGTAERDVGMTATYRLLPGRATLARFEYSQTRFSVVWARDGTCVTDSAAIAALIAACTQGDDGALDRATRGIARARPADPDRTGTTWGVIATSAMPETPSGTVTVACHGLPRETAGRPCDDHKGDTACRTSLPVLCSKADTALPPTSPRARRLALTAPVPGTGLASVAVADQVCRAAFGDGWKMTEAEESLNKYQITGVGTFAATSRFWVRNGEGLANCW